MFGFLPTVPDHGAFEEDNKLEGVVGCFVALSSASHHTISAPHGTFMCR
jgi:hypothetical protein